MNGRDIPISIGLDFGTYQTKACVRFKRSQNSPPEYHFVPLDIEASGLDSFFLPSVISELDNGRFGFGKVPLNAKKSYSFFKIASADDEEFRLDLGLTKAKYNPERFYPYTPEFLAVVYVAYVITKIKSYVTDVLFKQKRELTENRTFLDKFNTNELTDFEFDWVVQMGVPTEYQEKHNFKRKRKFQQILLMAYRLSMLVNGEFVTHSSAEELKEAAQKIFDVILEQLEHNTINAVDTEKWNDLLNTEKVSVFPETAAGLVFLVRTGKLTKDKYYLAVDIGGGSTDVSFFKVEDNQTFTYYASKSVMVASNDIGIRMVDDHSDTMKLREKIVELYTNTKLQSSIKYQEAFSDVFGQINKHVYRMFNGQVYQRFPKMNARSLYADTYCYLYGGGSLVPRIDPNPAKYLESIVIHDNGVRNQPDMQTRVSVVPTDELRFTENIHPPNWSDKMQFLIVPLGLSLAMDDEIMTQMNEEFYTKDELIKDPGLFDVRHARWV